MLPAHLQRLIAEETAQPVRPGKPGEQPFWNRFSKGFMYAPAFGFKEVRGASSYRFTLAPERGGPPLSFEAKVPWAPLSPVWNAVPVGFIRLTVEGLADGKTVGVAGTRRFYRKAVFEGKGPAAARGYKACGELKLKHLYETSYVRYWLDHDSRDPEYGLYCYPSKIIGSILTGLVRYGTVQPEARDTALAMARHAADFLIRSSTPADAAYPYFPPTYRGDYRVAKGKNDIVMMIYPQSVALSYLDLYDATRESRYFTAAENIARTYARTQLKTGTWPLMVKPKSGRIVSNNAVVPIGVIRLFERFDKQYGNTTFRRNAKRAMDWIIANPIRTFNWEGQFEDVRPSAPYRNLTHGNACAIAVYMLEHADQNPDYARWALEILRYAEDQFVVWDRHNPELRHDNWLTPCALEQYSCYEPINASAAGFIRAWTAAYKYTGQDLFKMKAAALANVMTTSQTPDGELPTYWYENERENWLNCSIHSAIAMIELEESRICAELTEED